MSDPLHDPIDRFTTSIRGSKTLRLLLVGVLVLVLQIPIAMIGGLVRERQTRRLEATGEVSSKWGKVQVVTGTSPHGQGHETSWSMIVADRLGISPDDVEVLHSDTAIAPMGMDTYGSRSLAVGAMAVVKAAEKVIAKAKPVAAHMMECAEDDLEFTDGRFRVTGTEKAVTLPEVALAVFAAHDLPDGLEPNLDAQATYDPEKVPERGPAVPASGRRRSRLHEAVGYRPD